MFPDRASLYVVAIEDRQYKDYKIHCKYRARAHVPRRPCDDTYAMRISIYNQKKNALHIVAPRLVLTQLRPDTHSSEAVLLC